MKRSVLLTTACVALLGLSACAQTDEGSRVNELEAELNSTEQMLSDEKSKNAQLMAQLENQPTQTAAIPASTGDADLPPAKPGECYARVLIPATYQTTTETVVASEASERVEVVPAQYEMGEERVLVREASERLEVIPATYKTVEERVMVSEASEELINIPATYETVSERVLVKPASTVWKKGRGPIEKIDASTGEIVCLVEIPAEYRTVTKRVEKTPARTEVKKIPAVYKNVTRTVVDQPASTRTVAIPAEYRSVKVRKMVSPPSENRIAIPAKYQEVTKRDKVSEERLEWRSILCETNTTPGVVSRIQAALKQKGFHPGPIDGVLGPDTMAAVNSYQKANNLPSGQLTMRTVQSLGVSL